MLHTDLTAVSSIELDLLPMEDLHHGTREFHTFFAAMALMTFIYKLDLCFLKMYTETRNELSVSRL